jgi:hypothetical protein
MAGHQIVRAIEGTSQGHTHVESVELADGTRLLTSQVVTSMLHGHSYFTLSPGNGARADVLPYKCSNCDRWWIFRRRQASGC